MCERIPNTRSSTICISSTFILRIKKQIKQTNKQLEHSNNASKSLAQTHLVSGRSCPKHEPLWETTSIQGELNAMARVSTSTNKNKNTKNEKNEKNEFSHG